MSPIINDNKEMIERMLLGLFISMSFKIDGFDISTPSEDIPIDVNALPNLDANPFL